MNPATLHFSNADLPRMKRVLAVLEQLRQCPGFIEDQSGLTVDANCYQWVILNDRRQALATSEKNHRAGPGNVIEWMLAHAGFGTASAGSCASFKKLMNRWGWWGCWKRRRLVIDWFLHQARHIGVELERQDATGLLLAGFKAIGQHWKAQAEA